MEPLHLRAICKSYPSQPQAVQVLNGITLTIEPGELFFLLGPSGCGKTTLLRCLAGLDFPTSGAIFFGERDVTHLAPHLRETAMVFQNYALWPHLTVAENIAFGLVERKIPTAERTQRVEQALRSVRLEGLGNRAIDQLSGGQRQRVVIAMAIALRPRLLIADEPTTALDVTTQAQILDLLKDLVQDFGMGLLMITHDLAVVSDMAERIVVMRYGEVVETGATKALFANMQHDYTKALFAASAHQVALPENTPKDALLVVKDAIRDYPKPRTELFAPRTYTRAVNAVSFTLRKGERIGLVGESGCGKSTLLSLLAGLEHTDEGEIKLGQDPVVSPGRDRLVMFQQDALFPWLDVLENVLFGLRLKPDLTEAERLESARYYLNLVGLGNKEKARPHELSGGMRQRVALARSLAPNPRVLLMDEPFSALDALTREQLYGDIQEIFTKRKKTIVLVTHNIREAVCLGDRVVLFSPNPGRVQQVFDVNLPRPRRMNDPALANLAAEVTTALSSHLTADQR